MGCDVYGLCGDIEGKIVDIFPCILHDDGRTSCLECVDGEGISPTAVGKYIWII